MIRKEAKMDGNGFGWEYFEESEGTPNRGRWLWNGRGHFGQIGMVLDALGKDKAKLVTDIVELLSEVLDYVYEENPDDSKLIGISIVSSKIGGALWDLTSSAGGTEQNDRPDMDLDDLDSGEHYQDEDVWIDDDLFI